MRNPTSTGHNRVALTAVAAELGVMFIGAILPTPLYPLYREAFGFSGVTLTLIYATYVLGNLTALLFFGRLADQIGRRSASLPAVAVGIASAVVFAGAQGTEWLFVARGVSGFSTGLASGAATAWIAELYAGSDKSRAARVASAANFFGCAAGPLIGGLFAQFAFAPLRLCYLAYLVLLCGAAGAILLPRETVTQPKPLGDIDLRPRIGVPPGIRLQFISPAVTGFATFSLIGFYSALIPSLLGETLHQSAPLVAGGVVCELFLVAAVAILTSGLLASQTATLIALLLLPPSVWILVGAEVDHSLALLLFAAALGGLAGGLGYRGSLEVINRIAPADRRSEVVSSYMIALFAGNSVPVIGIGFLAAATTALTAHVIFAAVLTVLAGLAMLTGLKFPPTE
ncbi:MAG TPA: MFS transporter [Xanthobacteraceae bacterium]|nr:MFS transporter [Xanthobacteraceae bacterium]